VPVGDAAAMGEAIARALADDETRRRRGAAGRARFLARFTAERMVRETEALYREVCTEMPVRAGSAA